MADRHVTKSIGARLATIIRNAAVRRETSPGQHDDVTLVAEPLREPLRGGRVVFLGGRLQQPFQAAA